MRENEYLQRQITLMHNTVLNLKDILASTGTHEQNRCLNIFGENMVNAFDRLEAMYKAAQQGKE